jgi:hypothetical protein
VALTSDLPNFKGCGGLCKTKQLILNFEKVWHTKPMSNQSEVMTPDKSLSTIKSSTQEQVALVSRRDE